MIDPRYSGTARRRLAAVGLVLVAVLVQPVAAEEKLPAKTGDEAGFRKLTEDDFTNVNCHEDTWRWEDGKLYCTGKPVGVMRTKKKFKNFEMVAEWCHRKPAGNSGIFLWATDESIERLAREGKPGLPHGVEVQVLDLDYGRQYEERTGKKGDWFTSHGDVFPVGVTTMNVFAPTSPNGSRSFPSENRSKGVDEWNHYYIRAVDGEVRLWVNGGEVSGGDNCQPAEGYLCLESEGAPIEFRNLKIRELP
ncbi:3-keto-disaccharide hydrolase [Rubinisphaera margarita]|uniref:3-keto-disaccharide hydrolase n=1 Tax=Rubinisphaera margarita TaxID=2909586 RepID=UPI001EE7CEA9|nr:DUF1080 domain-containing protein [Rubinisphaera margarita]MCG6156038.1 DUF1080 domain-containing protein [Rubinisphaera margarita]